MDLTVKDIVDSMREMMEVTTASNSNNSPRNACTGGVLLTILADAIPQVVAMKMPGAGQMSEQFLKNLQRDHSRRGVLRRDSDHHKQ